MITPNIEPPDAANLHAHVAHKPRGQERTADDPQKEKEHKPDELTKEEQRQLIEVVRKYKQSWFLRRRMIVKRVLKAYEVFKGNHFISFDPESFQYFDAMQPRFATDGAESGDGQESYQVPTKFYQL